MRLLGLACGSVGGNSEILLKNALMTAEATGITVEMIRLVDLAIPAGRPGTLPVDVPDDRPFVIEKLIDCDALIIAAPIYTRTPPGLLKLLIDRAFGPRVDVAAMLRAKAGQQVDDPRYAHNIIDERLLKPRVGGFLAIGGAISADWTTFGLPLMHMATFSMHIAIVDQVQVLGSAMPGTIVLDETAMARARTLGANVAAQIGQSFNDAVWLGDTPGTCPACHLDMIVLKMAGAIECAVCAHRGHMAVIDGKAQAVFPPEGRRYSILSLEGKMLHQAEMDDVTTAVMPRMSAVAALRAPYDSYDRLIPPPSNTRE